MKDLYHAYIELQIILLAKEHGCQFNENEIISLRQKIVKDLQV